MMPSYPAYLSSGPKWPPELAAPMVPVRGDLATALYRPEEVAQVPVRGPVMKISLLSGPRGSQLGSHSSQ